MSKFDNAITDYTKAIKLCPDEASLYYRRGVAYSGKGNVKKAAADYREALRRAPDFEAAKEALAKLKA
jgi:tetratricopeptide (TPR) repeat protein